MAKLTASDIARMSDNEITEIYEAMGKTRRVPARPPRRPRGEKSQTTIRVLRRQMTNLAMTIQALRLAADDKDKVIAGFDVQLSEADDQIKSLQARNADQAAKLGWAKDELRHKAERLAYLEGYHAKSQEIRPAPPAIRTTGALVAGDSPETHTRGRAGDPEGLSIRGQTPEGARSETGAERHGATAGNQIWGFRRDDQAYPKGHPLEHIEITAEERERRASTLGW